MPKLFLLLIAVCDFWGAGAQSTSRWEKLQGSVGLSLLNGQSGVSGRLGLEAGYELPSRFSAHLGVALDYYYLRTVPVFFEIQRAVSRQPKHFFAYAGGGMNLAWPTQEERNMGGGGWGIATPVAHRSGLFTQIGVGRTMGKQSGRGFVLRLGHSFKSFSETYAERIWNGSNSDEASRKNLYQLGMLECSLRYML